MKGNEFIHQWIGLNESPLTGKVSSRYCTLDRNDIPEDLCTSDLVSVICKRMRVNIGMKTTTF